MARSHLVSTSFRKSSSESPSWVVDDAGHTVMTCDLWRVEVCVSLAFAERIFFE